MTAEQRLRELVAKHSPDGMAALPEAIMQVGVPNLLSLFEAMEAWSVALHQVLEAAKAFHDQHGVMSGTVH